MKKLLLALLFGYFLFIQAFSQENYEIQVYGSQTVAPKVTMVELHSNFTFTGSNKTVNNVLPTHHVFHETIEVTHGFNNWFEIGFYLFNTIGSNNRTNFVGSHLRPRVRVPDNWNWPVGASLSVEGGYQKLQYSEDDWSVEIRPIVDKSFGKFYLSFNPTFEKSLHGLNSNKGFVFSPNVKSNYGVSSVWSLGLEYYGSLGTFMHLNPYQEQEHELFAVADVTFSPDWELNFGYGKGLNKFTDNDMFKVIVGYRIK